jgi:hypothetical protein
MAGVSISGGVACRFASDNNHHITDEREKRRSITHTWKDVLHVIKEGDLLLRVEVSPAGLPVGAVEAGGDANRSATFPIPAA